MDFGVFDHLDRGNVPLSLYYEARLQLVEMYDQAGFYGYHVAEHHGTPLGMAPSPSVFLAGVAQRTKRLRFGPMVYALPLYHPLRLAEEICMLDQLSDGRLEIGFGRGASPLEIDIFGRDPEEAHKIYLESLKIITMALTQHHLDFEGEFFTFKDVPVALEPKQLPHPPLWYGMHAVESAERAGDQDLNVISLDTSAETREMVTAYKNAWSKRYSRSKWPKIGIGRFIVVGENEEVALYLARRAYRVWHSSFNFLFRYRGAAEPRHQRPAEFEAMAEMGRAVAGTPEKVIDFLGEEMVQSDANYLVGQFAFGDMSSEEVQRSVGLFISEVMPYLSESLR